MFKIFSAILLLTKFICAYEAESVELRGQIVRMAAIANVHLESVDDIHFQKSLEAHKPYWVMNLLYETGRMDFILLADSIYLSGLARDNCLIEVMGCRWSDNISLNFEDVLILKTRGMMNGYIIGLYGSENNMQQASCHLSLETRRAYEHRHIFNNPPPNCVILPKWKILKKVWAIAYRNASEDLSYNNNSIISPIFLDPIHIYTHTVTGGCTADVSSPPLIQTVPSAPDLTPTRKDPPSPIFERLRPTLVHQVYMHPIGDEMAPDDSPLADLFRSSSDEIEEVRHNLNSNVRPQGWDSNSSSFSPPSQNSSPLRGVNEAFQANPIHEHESLGWFGGLGAYF
jgi:hypothetical protein